MRFHFSSILILIAFSISPNSTKADHGGIENIPLLDDIKDPKEYREALFHSHQACARNAQLRVPSANEAAFCSDIFLLLKLSFLPDTNPENYRGMTPVARATANRKGYQAYMGWVHRYTAEQARGDESIGALQ